MTAPITAGGTLPSEGALSFPSRVWRWIEMAILFAGGPIGMYWLVHGEKMPIFAATFGQKIPIFVALLPVLTIAVLMLLADPTFQLRRELSRRVSWRNALSILTVFAIGGGYATYWVLTHHPDWFLEFPTNRPETYRRIMLAYPLFSVAAQELLYRTFYFHRYGPLFGSQRWLAVIVNGVAFGFAHIVMGSQFAIIATMLGGLILAARYAQTRSFWAVFIEHTIWGWLIFTVGLGRYFFTGVSNV
ncbi:CPBP family intramembrane glutamic endopeptidase [Hyphomicrobium sp.]|uniref:CPBP family intramembrane glutamic endopeptidase n=1 Tax=Hyphomicrobium sp. TaxID=82 RepID=UPI003F730391